MDKQVFSSFVLAMEQVTIEERLIRIRESLSKEGLTTLQIVQSMGLLLLKDHLALEEYLQDPGGERSLRSYAGWFGARRIYAQVEYVRQLERGQREWKLHELLRYAHAVGLATIVEFVPAIDDHSLEARDKKFRVPTPPSAK